MKLYYHPVSTTCRPIMMFASESGIAIDLELVDLFTGAQYKPDYAAINASCQVPTLDDDGFRLTESSAILKYLADKAGSPAYPKDLQARARVNEMMDWFNANMYKDYGYGLVYPQTFPHHKRPGDAVQSGTLEWGKQKTQSWLKILDHDLIGPSKAYLCGDRITLADYMGAEMVALGDVIRCSYAGYPNIERWLGNMRKLKSWPQVHQAIDGFTASLKDQPFVTL